MNGTIAIISCLTEAKRGEPITCGRHYALLPIINKELLRHQLEALHGAEIFLLVDKGNEQILAAVHGHTGITLLDVKDKALVAATLKRATLFLPGDVLPLETLATKNAALVVLENGSEEEAALRALLLSHGMTLPELLPKALRINYPWELVTANQQLCKELKTHIDPSVKREENVTIVGPVVIGANTVLKANTYIEGPVVIGKDCEIGPFCHLRPETSVGDGCRIGKTEIVDSVLLPGVTSKHAAYLGHSVLGKAVNIGAFTVTADYRHDGKSHVTLSYETGEPTKVDTKRRKLGSFMGDNVHTAITTSIYPGRKLWPGTGTLPGEVVKEDKRG